MDDIQSVSGTTQQSSQGGSPTSLQDALNQIGTALSAGDLTSAQNAFNTLQTNLQQSAQSHGHHHHHHHGGASSGSNTAQSTESTDPNAAVVNNSFLAQITGSDTSGSSSTGSAV